METNTPNTRVVISQADVPVTCGKCGAITKGLQGCTECSKRAQLEPVVEGVEFGDDIDEVTKACLEIITYLKEHLKKAGAYLVEEPRSGYPPKGEEPEGSANEPTSGARGRVLRFVEKHRTDYNRNLPLSDATPIYRVRKLIREQGERLVEVEEKGWSVARYLLDEDYRREVYSEFKEKVRPNRRKLNRFFKAVSIVAGTVAAVVVGIFT